MHLLCHILLLSNVYQKVLSILSAGMSHIIDDFLFVGPPNSDKCLVDLQCFSSLCSRLGVPLKPEKTILPTTTIVIYATNKKSSIM
jgi:hypothetical protein